MNFNLAVFHSAKMAFHSPDQRNDWIAWRQNLEKLFFFLKLQIWAKKLVRLTQPKKLVRLIQPKKLVRLIQQKKLVRLIQPKKLVRLT